METQWAVSRAPESRQDSRRSTSAISDSSSRWPRQTAACTASTAATRCASEWKSFLPTLPPTDPGEEQKRVYRTCVRLSSPSVCLSERAPCGGVEDVPMLGPRACLAVLFFLLKSLELEPLEQRASLADGKRRHVILRGPRIPVAKELSREPACGADRASHPLPHLAEAVGVTEEETEAGPHEIGGRQLDPLHPRDECAEPRRQARGHALAHPPDRLLLRVDREDNPSALEHGEGIDAAAAAEIHRLMLFRAERIEDVEEHLARGTIVVLVVVPGPLARVGHRSRTVSGAASSVSS